MDIETLRSIFETIGLTTVITAGIMISIGLFVLGVFAVVAIVKFISNKIKKPIGDGSEFFKQDCEEFLANRMGWVKFGKTELRVWSSSIKEAKLDGLLIVGELSVKHVEGKNHKAIASIE